VRSKGGRRSWPLVARSADASCSVQVGRTRLARSNQRAPTAWWSRPCNDAQTQLAYSRRCPSSRAPSSAMPKAQGAHSASDVQTFGHLGCTPPTKPDWVGDSLDNVLSSQDNSRRSSRLNRYICVSPCTSTCTRGAPVIASAEAPGGLLRWLRAQPVLKQANPLRKVAARLRILQQVQTDHDQAQVSTSESIRIRLDLGLT
jgi:hypothetical protein